MKDTVLRGTGNSRTLRTVANAKTQYPNFDSFLTALVNGTFPVDIGALNSSGLTTRGTDLNKANILTDATATGMGLTSSATPNQAFAKLRALIKAAQDDADDALSAIGKSALLETGTYVGAGSGDYTTKTFTFGMTWEWFLLIPRYDFSTNGFTSWWLAVRGVNTAIHTSSNSISAQITSTAKSLTLSGAYLNNTVSYGYIAIGHS